MISYNVAKRMTFEDIKVASITLTLNEEARIEECLKHLRPYVDYIYVLDGWSEDRTVDIAKKYADFVEVKSFSGSFAEERNYAESRIPLGYEWVLHCDADERFDERFLKNMKLIIAKNLNVLAFRFPRNNYGLKLNWPDYQVRLLRRNMCVWKRGLHEIPFTVAEDRPVDEVSCETLDDYPIIHLPRRKEIKREWW